MCDKTLINNICATDLQVYSHGMTSMSKQE